MSLDIKLQKFEGPLDLLLHLIREHKMDIYDIPIAEITKQYIDYLDQMEEMNLDIAGEFLLMASTLTYIKSRLLLPQESKGDIFDDEGADPRAELVRRLLEYQRFKEVADGLKMRPLLGKDVFRSNVRVDIGEFDGELSEGLVEINVVDLAFALNKILENKKDGVVEFQRDQVSILDAIHGLVDKFSGNGDLVEVFGASMGKNELIATFLALLELIRLKLIQCFQNKICGIIYAKKVGDLGDLNQLHIERFEQTSNVESA